MSFTSLTPVFTQLAGQTIPGSLTVSGNLRMNGGADGARGGGRTRARGLRGVRPGSRPSAAGGWGGAPPFAPLRRPPSPPIGAYRTLVDVPIGNDGIAFPALFTAAGAAQAFAGPSGIGTSWEPSQAAVYTSLGPNDPALATVFVGPLPLAHYQLPSFLLPSAPHPPPSRASPLGQLSPVVYWIRGLGGSHNRRAEILDYEQYNRAYEHEGSGRDWAEARITRGLRAIFYCDRANLHKARTDVGPVIWRELQFWIPTLDGRFWGPSELSFDIADNWGVYIPTSRI